MCGRVKISGMTYFPGTSPVIEMRGTYRTKIWGVADNYNARIESIKTAWKGNFLCVLTVDSFFEGGALLGIDSGKKIDLACICGFQRFWVMTQPASHIVKHYHHRMPMVLSDKNAYLNQARIIQINYSKLILVA